MKKRKTLPNSFRELLTAGDVDALKAVFERCEINAIQGRYGSNAFSMGPLPRDFAIWLKAQGGDVNQADYYGEPPILNHASAYYGDVALLIELGADPRATGRNLVTPLHLAATYGRLDAVHTLLQHGADVNAQTRDRLMGYRHTPLEMMLLQDRIPLDTTVEICNVLLGAGAQMSQTAKGAVTTIGERFEKCKHDYRDAARLKSHVESLSRLYALFDVPPVPAIEVHSGAAPILVSEARNDKAFHQLWDYLVPSSGHAATVQGELIRLVGKIFHEILDNGGINWDEAYRKIPSAMAGYFEMGVQLPAQQHQEAVSLSKRVSLKSTEDDFTRLASLSVDWIRRNPTPISLTQVPYAR